MLGGAFVHRDRDADDGRVLAASLGVVMLLGTLHNRHRRLPPSGIYPKALRAAASAFDATMAFTIGYGVPGYGWEGGEADNPADPGGFTWRGITLSNYRIWVNNQNATAAQLLAMSEDDILAFYGCNYWNTISGNQLPPAVGLSVCDFGINAGPWTSARILQGQVGAFVDGSIGPETLAAVALVDPGALIANLSNAQLASYQTDADWPTFGAGWTNRTAARLTAAQALL